MASNAPSRVLAWEWGSVATMSLLAFAASAFSGSRGLFAFDEAILFDGGFRVLSGQVPYRDFLIPFGPIPFLLQSMFFGLFGVNWPAFLAHAALFNAAAAVITWWLVRRVGPEHPSVRIIAMVAAGATAAWFYPPVGVPFFEQTAFFLHLCGLAALHSRRRVAGVAAGVLFAMAFLSKQNVGVLSAAMGLWIGWRTGALRQVLAGLSATGLIFALWLAVFSDPRAFLRSFVEIPLAEAGGRLGRMDSLAGAAVTLPGVLECAIFGFAAVSLFGGRAKGNLTPKAPHPLEVALGLIVFRLAFAALTNNSPLGLFGFAGLSTGLSMAAVLAARPHSRPRAVLLSLPLFVLAALGLRVSVNREVHDFWWDARFDDVRVSRELWPARWGGGDRARAPRVPDFDAVVDRLRTRGKPFFVFPDTTIMYGLVGRPSTQPLVWFHKGVTYSSPDSVLDARLVQALVSSQVMTVVVEDVSFLGTDRRLKDFPALRRFIDENFVLDETHGIFRILERRPPAAAPESGG